MVMLSVVMAFMDHGSRISVGLDRMWPLHGMAAFRVSRDAACLRASLGTSRWAMLMGQVHVVFAVATFALSLSTIFVANVLEYCARCV